jgi:hypothetical protein
MVSKYGEPIGEMSEKEFNELKEKNRKAKERKE